MSEKLRTIGVRKFNWRRRMTKVVVKETIAVVGSLIGVETCETCVCANAWSPHGGLRTSDNSLSVALSLQQSTGSKGPDSQDSVVLRQDADA